MPVVPYFLLKIMKKVLFFTLLSALTACVTESGPAQQTLNAAQLENLLNTDKSVQVVDVRTPEEVRQSGKIGNAVVIDYSAPDFAQKVAQLDKKRPVVVYCAAGGRSPRAAAKMTQMGFQKVYDYNGGMNDWLAKGKKTLK